MMNIIGLNHQLFGGKIENIYIMQRGNKEFLTKIKIYLHGKIYVVIILIVEILEKKDNNNERSNTPGL